MVKSRFNSTCYYIMCEMNGYGYEATNALRSLAIECKKYLLDTLNSQVFDGRINDPVFGCSIKSFHNHKLAWNKLQWRKSAEIVYRYFEATSLLKTIREYESIFGTKIINDYDGSLEYIYNCLSNEKQIEWYSLPSIGKDISLIPEKVLEDKIARFKELYE